MSEKELERFESAYQARATGPATPFDRRLPLLLHVAVLVPMVVGLALVVAVLLAREPQVRGSLNVLHLSGASVDLWLGFAGACASRSAATVCKIVRGPPPTASDSAQAPASAYYETIESALGVSSHPGLAVAIPPNLGAASLLLVLGSVCAGLATALQTWGSADFQCASPPRPLALTTVSNAQSYQRQGRHGWLGAADTDASVPTPRS